MSNLRHTLILELKLQTGTDNKKQIQKIQQLSDGEFMDTFIDTGRITKIQEVGDLTLLHEFTTDVILYSGGHYIEMLKNGKFLYRPSGRGQGKRSLSLPVVENYMFKKINK